MSEKNKIPKELIEKEENICFGYETLKEIEPIDWDEVIIKEEDEEYKKENNKEEEINNEESK